MPLLEGDDLEANRKGAAEENRPAKQTQQFLGAGGAGADFTAQSGNLIVHGPKETLAATCFARLACSLGQVQAEDPSPDDRVQVPRAAGERC